MSEAPPPTVHDAFKLSAVDATYLTMSVEVDGASLIVDWETTGHIFDSQEFPYDGGTIGDLVDQINASGTFTATDVDPTATGQPGEDLNVTNYSGVTPQPRHSTILATYV